MPTSQSFLLGRGGKKSQSFLIKAGGAAGTGRIGSRSFLLKAGGATTGVSAVDAGFAQTLEPFQKCTLTGVVTVPNGGSAASMTWAQVVSQGQPVVTLTPNGFSASFETPAKVAGVVLTFRLTATFNGLPNATDTVQITVRPHAEWMAISSAQFIPVLETFDAATDIGGDIPAGFGLAPFGISPFGV